MKEKIILKLLKVLDYLINPDKDNPIYICFLGEGEVQIQESGKTATNYQL